MEDKSRCLNDMYMCYAPLISNKKYINETEHDQCTTVLHRVWVGDSKNKKDDFVGKWMRSGSAGEYVNRTPTWLQWGCKNVRGSTASFTVHHMEIPGKAQKADI